MNSSKYKSKSYQKRPLALLVGGVNKLGFELADLLLQHNANILFIDNYSPENQKKLSIFPKDSAVSLLDYKIIPTLDEELKRLDYVFYFNHDCFEFAESTKQITKKKNNLDVLLALSTKYRAKFLLTTTLKTQPKEESTINEFKKYSEKLTQEYINKVNLNGRIVVLGEILGDGMNFECDKKITKLILNAAKGESLQIPRKVMEKEWLINIWDAAHGIFKAQYSRVTNGGTYLVAYPNPYTYISLAYKVQEIEQAAKDIEFYDEEENTEKIKIPQSLTEVGWSPKVSLEKALKQSIAAAKIYLIENEPLDESNKGLSKKIKAFFEINSEGRRVKSESLSEIQSGPVSRLIIERKRQEEATRRSLQEESRLFESHKMKRPIHLSEKFEETSISLLGKLKNYLSEIRKKSKLYLIRQLFLSIALILFFIFIASPVLILGKDIGIILISYENLKNDLNNNNYSALSSSSKNITYALEDANYILGKFGFLFNILGQDQSVGGVRESLQAYTLFSEGINNISMSVEPLYKYFNEYSSNLELKNSEDGYLKVNNDQSDYENIILDAAERSPYLILGMDKINKSLSRTTQIDYNALPTFLSERFLSINQEIRGLQNNLSQISPIKYIPELLGVYEEKTYAIVLLNNLNPKPIGGEVTSLILLTVVNGSIKEVTVDDLISTDFKFTTLDKSVLEKINKGSFESIEKVSSINDFENFTDFDEFSRGMSLTIKENFEKDIDGTILINSSSLEEFIFKFSEKYDFVSNGVNFSKNNLLNYLKNVSKEENFDEIHSKLTTELLSQVIFHSFNNLSENFNTLYGALFESRMKQNILVHTPSQEYDEYVKRENLGGLDINKSDIFLRTFFTGESNDFTYLNLDIESNITITLDSILTFRNVYKLPQNANNSNLNICLPLYIRSEDIKIYEIPEGRFKLNRDEREQCVIIKIEDEKKIEVGWNVRSFKIMENDLSMSLMFGKIKGVTSKLDLNLTLEPGVKLASNKDLLQISDHKYTLNQILSSDKGIKLTIRK